MCFDEQVTINGSESSRQQIAALRQCVIQSLLIEMLRNRLFKWGDRNSIKVK